jgi:hypothetical protein
MCNTVLNCLASGRLADLDGALGEIKRLLRPGGRFVCCVHVSALADLHLGYRVLLSLGLRTSADRYLGAIHRSNGRTIHLSTDEWVRRLTGAGFIVERTVPFFTRRDSRLRRELRLLRWLPSRPLALRLRDRLVQGYRGQARRRRKEESCATGYVLMVARTAAPAYETADGKERPEGG